MGVESVAVLELEVVLSGEVDADLGITYHIQVHTGDVSGAGTDANVYIYIIGDKGSTGQLVLDGGKFERDDTDSFKVTAPDVGTITSVRIGHDNKGGFAGWYLYSVTVTVTYAITFVADRWLDKSEGDGALEVTLHAHAEGGAGVGGGAG